MSASKSRPATHRATRTARTRSPTWLAAALLALAACTRQTAPAAQPPAPETQPAAAAAQPNTPDTDAFSAPGPDGYGRAGALRYLEHVVGAAPEATLPMVVVIHGLGDRPGPHWLDLVQLKRPARVIMPEAPTPYLDGFSWFPFRARGADPAELAAGIGRAADQLAAALETLTRRRPTVGRPLVTGFSQGGMLSFELALHHPERLQLALPISGTLPEPLWPTRPASPSSEHERRPPIVALHGTADELVPFAATERLVAKLKLLGYDATLLRDEAVGHHISEATQARVAGALDEALASIERERAAAAPATPAAPAAPSRP